MEKIMDSTEPSFWDFKGQTEYSDQLFLMATPFPIVLTLVAYLWFVLKFGPEFMEKRKPYQLGNILVAYNFIQVVLSAHLFQTGVQFITTYGLWGPTCYWENSDVNKLVQNGSHLYFICKVVELLDTVFFVLRKKQRQVTFLHVYHHTLMAMSTWMVVKYNRTDATVFVGTINSLVHIIMYAYYGLSVFPALTKFLWWKKYITIMQLIQFVMMFVHIIISHMVSECKTSYILLFAVVSNTMLFMYLFGDFYIKSYSKKIKTEEKKVPISNDVNPKNSLNYLMTHSKFAAKIN